MPRLRQAKQLVSDIEKPFDSSEIKAKEEEPLHENAEAKEELHENETVETKPEIKAAEVEEKIEDPTLALQKQLVELKKSEEIQRNLAGQAAKERDAAITRARERDIEVTKFQKEATQANYDNISTALAAAQESAEAAKRDMRVAISNSDPDQQTDAMERLATARANISRLEDGKYELEARVKAEKTAPRSEPQVQQVKQDPLGLDKSNLPDEAKIYLRAHPELITDPRKNARLQAWHWDAIDAGHEPFSSSYFEFIDEKRQPKKIEKIEEPVQQQRTNIVSAPVSREVPSGGATRQNGKITLTALQREAAKIAGVTEAEYARNVQKLTEAKANGQYTGGQ